MNIGFLWVTLGVGLMILAPSRGMAQQNAAAAPPVKITLLNGNILTGTVGATDAEGLTFNLQSGPMRFAWTQLDTNELKKTTPALYDHMVGLKSGFPTAQAAPQPKAANKRGKNEAIAIRLLDGTQLEGIPSRADAKGFSLRTKYATTHYDWSQIDTNALKQVDADLYQTMVEKVREAAAHPASGTVTTIRLRDGTEQEGTISGTNAEGFNLRGKFGSVKYDWTQLDLKDLQQRNPELFAFMVQKTREEASLDQIVTDEQILRFAAGKFVFKSGKVPVEKVSFILTSIGVIGLKVEEDVPLLKNYGRVLQDLNSALRIKSGYQRDQKLRSLVSQNRVMFEALDKKCMKLRGVTRSTAIQLLLMNYNRAIEALLNSDFAGFRSAYAFVQESLTQMGY